MAENEYSLPSGIRTGAGPLADMAVNTFMPGLLGGSMLGANSINRLMAMIQAQQGKMAAQSISSGRQQFENMYTNVMRTSQGGSLSADQEMALSRQAQAISGAMAGLGEGVATLLGPMARSTLQQTGLEHLGVLGMPYMGRDISRAASGIPGMDASSLAQSVAGQMYGAGGRYNVGYTGGLGGVGVGSAVMAASMAGNAPLNRENVGALSRSASLLQSMMGGGDPGELLSSFNEATGGAVGQLPASDLENMVRYMRTATMATMLGPASAAMSEGAMAGAGQLLASEAMRAGLPGPSGFRAATDIAPFVSGAMVARAGSVTERQERSETSYDPDTGGRMSEAKVVSHGGS